MTAPSPYEVGFNIGSNIGKGLQAYQDRSALDEVLMRANQTQDPNVINDTMQQILTRVSPEKQPMAMQILQNKQQQIQQQIQRTQKMKSLQAAGIPEHLIDADPLVLKEFLRERQQNDLLKRAGLFQENENVNSPAAVANGNSQKVVPPFKLPETPQPAAQKQSPTTNLSKEQIQMVTFLKPELGKVLQQQQTDREKAEREKTKFEATQEYRKSQLDQKEKHHWESTTGKWVSEQLSKIPELEKQEEITNQLKTTVNKVSGPVNRAWLSKQLGPGWEWISSKEGNIFEAGLKNQFYDAKDMFPGRVTDNDTRIFEKGLAGIGKNEAANKLIITQQQAKIKLAKARINEMRKILEKNPYMPEFQLREQIEKNITPLVDKIFNEWRKALYEAAGTPPEEQEFRTSVTPEKRKTLDEIFGK